MFPRVTLFLGGAASGKSDLAEAFVRRFGKPMIYLATSQAHDDEMRDKIDRHRARRTGDWTTIEAPLDVASALADLDETQTCLLDCATLWLSNQLLENNDIETAQSGFLAAVAACAAPLVIVSNEVGHGIVPDNSLARAFREAQGRLNIALAAQADLVVSVTAGLPTVLKGKLP